MKLLVLWLHVVGVVVWVGGVLWQSHVLLPVARGDGPAGRTRRAELIVIAMRQGRPVTWVAVAVVVLTGFYNVTQLGPVDRIMATGAGLRLAGKFILVLIAITVAGQRDFAHLPRLSAALAAGEDPARALRSMAWLDRLVLVLAMVAIYLGLSISRG